MTEKEECPGGSWVLALECAEASLGRIVPLRTSVETVMSSRGLSCALTGHYLEDTTRLEDSMDFLGKLLSSR